ncbi:MAG: hypothetical protein Q9219_000801 [cf. Caloplaca sp. 3 TL-2023]
MPIDEYNDKWAWSLARQERDILADINAIYAAQRIPYHAPQVDPTRLPDLNRLLGEVQAQLHELRTTPPIVDETPLATANTAGATPNGPPGAPSAWNGQTQSFMPPPPPQVDFSQPPQRRPTTSHGHYSEHPINIWEHGTHDAEHQAPSGAYREEPPIDPSVDDADPSQMGDPLFNPQFPSISSYDNSDLSQGLSSNEASIKGKEADRSAMGCGSNGPYGSNDPYGPDGSSIPYGSIDPLVANAPQTTIWSMPPSYATAENPMTPQQQAQLEPSALPHAHTVPQYATYGIAGSAAPSAEHSHPNQSNTEQPMHECDCGPDCQCEDCIVHPYNSNANARVRGLADFMADYTTSSGAPSQTSSRAPSQANSGAPSQNSSRAHSRANSGAPSRPQSFYGDAFPGNGYGSSAEAGSSSGMGAMTRSIDRGEFMMNAYPAGPSNAYQEGSTAATGASGQTFVGSGRFYTFEYPSGGMQRRCPENNGFCNCVRQCDYVRVIDSGRKAMGAEGEKTMNWTGGSLSRSRKNNANLTVIQKKHFAKARAQLLSGRPPLSRLDASSVHNAGTQMLQSSFSRARSRPQEQPTTQTTLEQFEPIRPVVKQLQSLKPRHANRPATRPRSTEIYRSSQLSRHHPAKSPQSKHHSSPESASVPQERAQVTQTYEGNATKSPPVDKLEAKRRELLTTSDWVGLEKMKPAKIKFPEIEDRDMIGKRRSVKNDHSNAILAKDRYRRPVINPYEKLRMLRGSSNLLSSPEKISIHIGSSGKAPSTKWRRESGSGSGRHNPNHASEEMLFNDQESARAMVQDRPFKQSSFPSFSGSDEMLFDREWSGIASPSGAVSTAVAQDAFEPPLDGDTPPVTNSSNDPAAHVSKHGLETNPYRSSRLQQRDSHSNRDAIKNAPRKTHVQPKNPLSVHGEYPLRSYGSSDGVSESNSDPSQLAHEEHRLPVATTSPVEQQGKSPHTTNDRHSDHGVSTHPRGYRHRGQPFAQATARELANLFPTAGTIHEDPQDSNDDEAETYGSAPTGDFLGERGREPSTDSELPDQEEIVASSPPKLPTGSTPLVVSVSSKQSSPAPFVEPSTPVAPSPKPRSAPLSPSPAALAAAEEENDKDEEPDEDERIWRAFVFGSDDVPASNEIWPLVPSVQLPLPPPKPKRQESSSSPLLPAGPPPRPPPLDEEQGPNNNNKHATHPTQPSLLVELSNSSSSSPKHPHPNPKPNPSITISTEEGPTHDPSLDTSHRKPQQSSLLVEASSSPQNPQPSHYPPTTEANHAAERIPAPSSLLAQPPTTTTTTSPEELAPSSSSPPPPPHRQHRLLPLVPPVLFTRPKRYTGEEDSSPVRIGGDVERKRKMKRKRNSRNEEGVGYGEKGKSNNERRRRRRPDWKGEVEEAMEEEQEQEEDGEVDEIVDD